jgi:hypothetical protein
MIGTKEKTPGISQELENLDGSYPLEQEGRVKQDNVDTRAEKKEQEETVLNNESEIGGNQVLISIKDTGSGIDPEIVSKLFSKFPQVLSKLGLSFARILGSCEEYGLK